MAQITRQLKDLSLPEEDCAIFEIRFQPKDMKVVWFREDTEVTENSDFRILTKNGMSTLVIGQVFSEDSGNYHAQLYNQDDSPTEHMSSASLTVAGGSKANKVTTGEKAPGDIYNKIKLAGIGILPMIHGKEQAYVNPALLNKPVDNSGPQPAFAMNPPSTGVRFNPRVEVSHPTYPDERSPDLPPIQEQIQNHVMNAAPKLSPLPKRSNPTNFTSVQPPKPKTNGPPPVRPNKPKGMTVPPPIGTGQNPPKAQPQMTKINPSAYQGGNNNAPISSHPGPVVPATASSSLNPPSSNTNAQSPSLSSGLPQLAGAPPKPKSIIKPVVHEPTQQTKQIVSEVASNQTGNRNASSPEPIDLDDKESNEVNQIQAHLAEQPPVFEDMEDAAFSETHQDKLLEPKIEEALFHTKVGVTRPLKLTCVCSGNPAPKAFWFKEGRQISKKSKHFITRATVEQDETDLKVVKYILYIHQTCQQDDGIYSCVIISPAGLAISSARILVDKDMTLGMASPDSSRNSNLMPAVVSEIPTQVPAKVEIREEEADLQSHSQSQLASASNLTQHSMSNTSLNLGQTAATLSVDHNESLHVKSGSELMAEEYEHQDLTQNSLSPNAMMKGLAPPQSSMGAGSSQISMNFSSPGSVGMVPQSADGGANSSKPPMPMGNINSLLMSNLKIDSKNKGYSQELLEQPQSESSSKLGLKGIKGTGLGSNPPSRPGSSNGSYKGGRGRALNRPASRGGFLSDDQLQEEKTKMKIDHPIKGRIEADEEVPTEKYYKPHFLQMPPAELSAQDGKFVRLDIKVTGLPIPQIEFLKDGYPIRRDHLHKIVVRENNIHSLLIEKANHNRDSGEYVVRAVNKAGTTCSKTRLHIQPKMEMVRPSFVRRMQGPLKLGVGETIVLEIQAKGNPPPQIGWKKGSDGIMPNDDRIILEYDEQTCSQKLTIHNITKYDQGWYTCSAVNRAGIASCTCKVDVLDEWQLEAIRGAPEEKEAKGPGSLYTARGDDQYDSPHLVVQKSSRLSHMQPELREALRDAYHAENQGPRPHYKDSD